MYRLIIIDQNCNKKIRLNNNELRLYWDNKNDINSKSSFSIINFIEQNSDHIKKIYLDWIDRIGNKKIQKKPLYETLDVRGKYKAWWHSNFIEKSNYENSPHISDALKLIALQEWIKDYKVNEIIFYSQNKKLAKCIYKFSINRKIIYKWHKTKNENTIKITKSIFKKFITYEIRALYFFFEKLFIVLRLENLTLKIVKKIIPKFYLLIIFSIWTKYLSLKVYLRVCIGGDWLIN